MWSLDAHEAPFDSVCVCVCVYIYTRANDTKRVVCVGIMCGGNRDPERKKANKKEWCLPNHKKRSRCLGF